MKTGLACVPCLLKGALKTMSLTHALSDDAQESIFRECVRIVSEEPWDAPAIRASRILNRLIMAHTGCGDPYRALRDTSNAAALAMLPKFRTFLESIDDPKRRLQSAAALAAAANVIDFTCELQLDLGAALSHAASADAPFAVDGSSELFGALSSTKRLLLFHDNSGEVAFDRLFLEQVSVLFPNIEDVCLVCKAGPLLNDVMRPDCEFVGMSTVTFGQSKSHVHYVELGDSDFGAWPPSRPKQQSPSQKTRFPEIDVVKTTPEIRFPEVFSEYGVVISKGQANYEAMESWHAGIFFMLTVKCDTISACTGAPLGTRVLIHS